MFVCSSLTKKVREFVILLRREKKRHRSFRANQECSSLTTHSSGIFNDAGTFPVPSHLHTLSTLAAVDVQKGVGIERAEQNKTPGEVEGGADSYPRRSSGFKETINAPEIQWRTNGPLSGPHEKRVSLQRLGRFSSVWPTCTKVHRVTSNRRKEEREGNKRTLSVSIDRKTFDKWLCLGKGRPHEWST